MRKFGSWSCGDEGWLGSIGIGRLALGLRANERWLGARRELEGGHAGAGKGGFHRWSVVGVATVLVVEAERGLEGVAEDGVVVPWEIVPWVSNVDQSEGPQGDVEHDHESAVLVGGGLGMLLVG